MHNGSQPQGTLTADREEAPVRLLLEGRWRTAARFLPWAGLDLLPTIDARVVRAALQRWQWTAPPARRHTG